MQYSREHSGKLKKIPLDKCTDSEQLKHLQAWRSVARYPSERIVQNEALASYDQLYDRLVIYATTFSTWKLYNTEYTVPNIIRLL